MTLLVVGGTADAVKITLALCEQGIDIVYSLAGLVRTPNLPCKIVVGGFTQFGGLGRFINDNNISAVLDVTHPFAQNISQHIARATEQCGIPYWQYVRPSWREHTHDQWLCVSSWPQCVNTLINKKCVFVTTGQVPTEVLDELAKTINNIVLRTAIKPSDELPKNVTWIKALGPFSTDDEIELMKTHHVDALVSKDSGGKATYAKIEAARILGIPVTLFEKPALPKANLQFTDQLECVSFITKYLSALP